MSNPYLESNYAPVTEEHTVTELKVTGHIPEHLDGRFLRNGPNPVSELDPATYHWFMGDGMVHGIRLRDGRAEWYRNRWVRSPRVSAALGEPPKRRGRGIDIGANTNVLGHAGKTLALVEGGAINYELTEELDTVGPCDFDGTLPGGYTAHPKRDPETGELHAVSYFFGMGNSVRYSVIGPDGKLRRSVDVKVTGSPMMHDFSLTEHYVVFYDLPVTFDANKAADAVPAPFRPAAKLVLSALIGKVRIPDPISAMMLGTVKPGGGLPYSWDPSYPARVGVMPRTGGADSVRWFDVEPCYVFHPMNAYEQDGTIVLDLVRHPRMFATQHNGPNEGTPTLDRWVVDLGKGKVREERLDDHGQEFPRVDERRTGHRHRYGYTMSLDGAVLKHDLDRGGVRRRGFGDGAEVGEFVFVPSDADRSAGADEDDGVLMGLVYDKAEERSALTLLDADSLDTVGTVELPTRVPTGFHGNWVPTE